MKVTGFRVGRAGGRGVSPALLVAGIAFSIGAVCGSFAARQVDLSQLAGYLSGYLSAAQGGELSVSLPQLLWKCLRGPLIACLLGFSALGLAGVPALLWCKGFVLAYGAAAFLRIYGSGGILPAFAALGVTGLLSLPALLLVGTQSWRAAGLRMTRPAMKHRIYDRAYWLTCCISGFFVTGQLLLEQYAVIPLLQWAVELR